MSSHNANNQEQCDELAAMLVDSILDLAATEKENGGSTLSHLRIMAAQGINADAVRIALEAQCANTDTSQRAMLKRELAQSLLS